MKQNMWSNGRKLLIMLVLALGFYVVSFNDGIAKHVAAAPCMEECEDNWASCKDDCQNSCSPDSTDGSCNSCIGACSIAHLNCMGSAVVCQIEQSYTPWCTTVWGSHTDNNGTHGGYYQVCKVIGHEDWLCIQCPTTANGHVCSNPNGYPPC